MNWLVLALGAAIFNALMDFFVKLASGKIHEGLGGFIINIFATIVLLVFVIISKLKGEQIFNIKPGGLGYSVLAGISIGIATICFIKMFAIGTNLSTGVPLVRISMILIASILGFLFLKEAINLRYLIGFLLSLVGLYLLITK